MITFSSDFGSPYPAAMRGVALQETDARLVDIAHDFPRQDVETAAFWLREIIPWFPPAVHCVVVDPGVGTDRAALVVAAGDHLLVGPDNGVLMPVARALTEGADGPSTYTIAYEAESTTFHGRDVFAPTAARLHDVERDDVAGRSELSPFSDPVDLSFPDPDIQDGRVVGAVLVIDGFGNAVTNIPGSVITDAFGDTVTVDGVRVPAAETYAAVDPGDPLVTVGSHGNVELAVNQGRGAEAFAVARGATVAIEFG